MSLNFLDFEQPIAELKRMILTAVSRQMRNWILTSTKQRIVCVRKA